MRKPAKFQIATVIVLAAISAAAVWLWRCQSYPSGVSAGVPDHRLTEMREPFRHVSTVGYERPNTIGVSILDANSFNREFAVQYAPNARYATPVIIVGGPAVNEPPSYLATNDAATRSALLDILIRYGRGRREIDGAIALITDRPGDHFRHRFDTARDTTRDLVSLLVYGDHGP